MQKFTSLISMKMMLLKFIMMLMFSCTVHSASEITLSKDFDCSSMNEKSVSSDAVYNIKWNGETLSKPCTLTFSNPESVREICITPETYSIKDCSFKLTFSGKFSASGSMGFLFGSNSGSNSGSDSGSGTMGFLFGSNSGSNSESDSDSGTMGFLFGSNFSFGSNYGKPAEKRRKSNRRGSGGNDDDDGGGSGGSESEPSKPVTYSCNDEPSYYCGKYEEALVITVLATGVNDANGNSFALTVYSSRWKADLFLGILFGVGIPVIIGVFLLAFFIWRRHRRNKRREAGQRRSRRRQQDGNEGENDDENDDEFDDGIIAFLTAIVGVFLACRKNQESSGGGSGGGGGGGGGDGGGDSGGDGGGCSLKDLICDLCDLADDD